MYCYKILLFFLPCLQKAYTCSFILPSPDIGEISTSAAQSSLAPVVYLCTTVYRKKEEEEPTQRAAASTEGVRFSRQKEDGVGEDGGDGAKKGKENRGQQTDSNKQS